MCYNRAAFAIDDAAYEVMTGVLGAILSAPGRLETASVDPILRSQPQARGACGSVRHAPRAKRASLLEFWIY